MLLQLSCCYSAAPAFERFLLVLRAVHTLFSQNFIYVPSSCMFKQHAVQLSCGRQTLHDKCFLLVIKYIPSWKQSCTRLYVLYLCMFHKRSVHLSLYTCHGTPVWSVMQTLPDERFLLVVKHTPPQHGETTTAGIAAVPVMSETTLLLVSKPPT